MSFDTRQESFCFGIKEELLKEIPRARHCRIAEFAAITAFLGFLKDGEERYVLNTDKKNLAKKHFTLAEKTFNIQGCSDFFLGEDIKKVSQLINYYGDGRFIPVNNILLQQECCQKAFLRGAFLAAGFVSDPNKSYQLEICTEDDTLSKQVLEVFNSLHIPAKSTVRKSYQVVYIKEGTLIVEALGLMGAPIGLMEFENVRILKDMRNDLNRKVNCETANIQKTINAAISQINDIQYIEDTLGLSELPHTLYEVAILRRDYPEASLTELGGMLDPAVGKSGINHRLRRISKFAEDLKKRK